VQLAVLVIGLFVLGPHWGIAGVALAVDAMLVVGIALLLWMARTDVDFSLARLLVVPGSAVVLGTVLARAAIMLPGVLGSDWRTAAIKVLVFSCVYGMILLALERHQFSDMFSFLGRIYERSPLGL
jgi:hypothetical protein